MAVESEQRWTVIEGVVLLLKAEPFGSALDRELSMG
jgi:hypothetical protein